MGSWGFGTFDNDTASDWATRLSGQTDTALIETAFDRVLAVWVYLEAPDAEEALAAADALACLLDGAAPGRPEQVADWLRSVSTPPSRALADKAARALDRIGRRRSELRSLWASTDDFAAWKQQLSALAVRLRTAA